MDIKPRTLLSAPFNRAWAMGHYLKDALDQLEVPVAHFDFREVDSIQSELRTHLEQFKPDLHLLFKGELFDRECLEIVKAAGVPTVLWQHDVFPELPPWLLEVAGCSDILFTHARGMVKRFKDAGIAHTEWLSEGFPESFFAYDKIEEQERKLYSCQVTLVGNIHRNACYRMRIPLIRRALDDGYRVKWWGPRISRRLNNIPLILSRVGRAYGRRFLANADFAKAVSCADLFLARDVYPEVDASVSNRLYWACGCGAFYLCEKAVGIEDIMTPGKEIETFSSLDEMSEKIRYYIDHPEERKRIAEAGQRRTLEQYTFRHRIEEMFERLVEVGVI